MILKPNELVTPKTETDRIGVVIRAAERWQNELVDTSGRNRLRRYRDLKRSTLDLTPGRAPGLNERVLDRMLNGRTVSLKDLFPNSGDLFDGAQNNSDDVAGFEDARRRLTAIRKSALTYLEEKGIETLFVAVGLATWEVDSGAPPNAPVILLPITVQAAGAAARDFRIQVVGDAHLNPVLAHTLRVDHEIDTDEDESEFAESPPVSFKGYLSLLNRLQSKWNALTNLKVEPRVVVAVFSYATMPLVADLEQNAGLFAANDIIAAIAGDAGARQNLAQKICDPEPYQPDIDAPKNEFLVLDADSSQHMAINRALGGESLVIQGPPGTGKSQTIANLITALVSKNKRVLFVAEKRAAIEAVTKRLGQVGLGDLVMDMHGGIASRREFARTLNDSLENVATVPAHDYSHVHRQLRRSRSSLIANDRALHDLRQPWKLSVFEMRQRLLGVPAIAQTNTRLSSEAAGGIDRNAFDHIEREIVEWVSLGGHALEENHPEWSCSAITTSDEARNAFEFVEELCNRVLPEVRTELFAVLDEVQIPRPNSVVDWVDTSDFLVVYTGSWWTRLKARIFSKKYRNMLMKVGATEQNSNVAERVIGLKKRVDGLKALLITLAKTSGIDRFAEIDHEELAESLKRMASGRITIANLPRIRELERRFADVGIDEVLDHVGKEIPPENVENAVEFAWLRRVLDDLEFDDKRLAAFDGNTHSRHRDEFVEKDCEHRDTTPQRVLRLTAEAIVATMNEHPEETLLVRREAAKKSRHLSVRQLFTRAPHVLSTLRPCWTMSPILAAEMIPAKPTLFDVVIFDEASQIPPAEAIGSLARAPQTIIAGDSRQLPPTSFFGRGSDYEEDEEIEMSLTNDIESLLDAASVLLRDQMLLWHYRSRDDRLIAFSNNHIYGGSLTSFPGAMVRTPIDHCLIPYRPILGVKGTRSNPDEVEEVVDLVLRHVKESPNESLGVIAFGQYHADNIENTLMRRLATMNDVSLDEFFSERNEERFFVKNIERVQGDERDAIILSVGYHKDENGKLPYRFGPMLQDGGERRLNVAITRARTRLTLVSSFSHRDMDPGRSSAKGVELLRQYLEYAASGGENLGSKIVNEPLNPFELSVKEGLERRGIRVIPQFGVSGYRIDFACAHPDEPGRMVLAIESDGASYHSAHTVRDRDRLRQQVLESKGWRFHRIWSTAWFRDRESELDKAETAWKQAIAASAIEDLNTSPKTLAPGIERSSMRPSAAPQRGPRPVVPSRGTYGYDNITDYSRSQLGQLARWIQSDTLLRTDDDLIREMMEEIGFKRSGTRIRDAMQQAILESRR